MVGLLFGANQNQPRCRIGNEFRTGKQTWSQVFASPASNLRRQGEKQFVHESG